MTNPKQKMSASYRAIFILSIFMVFFVLIAGAATKSKSSGFGMWIWGYTAWLMYKRRNADLVSFYKGLLWFDLIAAGIALSVLTFSEGDVGRYVGYTAVEAALLFAIVISLTYGLYRFFSNQSNLISESTYFDTNSSIEDKYWEQASHEFDVGDRVVAIWARAFSEADGDENKAKARYLMMRVEQLSSTNADKEHLAAKSKNGSKIAGATYRYTNEEIKRSITHRSLTCNHCERYGPMMIKMRLNWLSKKYYLQCPACGNTDS